MEQPLQAPPLEIQSAPSPPPPLPNDRLVKRLIDHVRNFECIFSKVYFCTNRHHGNISTLEGI